VKRTDRPPADVQARPLGTETPRPRWVLLLWAALYLAWFIFVLALAVNHRLHS
jgi:hypothetical protein